MVKRITLALVGVVALLLAAPAGNAAPGAQAEATIARSFDVAAGGTLHVDASFGSIEVTTAGGNRVEVTVQRQVRDEYAGDAQRILSEHRVEIAESGDGVVVGTEVGDNARDRWNDEYRNTPLRVRLEISVPSSYGVDLETRGGNISVADLDGAVRTETAGGNLTFGNIGGSVEGHTAGGNITLDGSSGAANLRTAGGNVVIGEVAGSVSVDTAGGSIRIERAGGDVEAETSGGNIEVDEVAGTIDASTSGGNIRVTITEQPSDDCRLSTSAGNVVVTLASGIALDIDAGTSVGRVSSDFAVDGSVGRRSIDGSINGGGPQLRLRTSAGSIRIEQR